MYIYDEYEDEFEDTYIKDKNSYKKKKYPKDNTFLIKASVYSSKVNTVLGLLVLSGVLLLPMAIAAELDINAISQQISVLQGILTDYYVDLLLNTEDIIGRLITIATTLTSISTAVAANAATLATNTNESVKIEHFEVGFHWKRSSVKLDRYAHYKCFLKSGKILIISECYIYLLI